MLSSVATVGQIEEASFYSPSTPSLLRLSIRNGSWMLSVSMDTESPVMMDGRVQTQEWPLPSPRKKERGRKIPAQ